MPDSSFVQIYTSVFRKFALDLSSNNGYLASPYAYLKRYDHVDKNDFARFRFVAESKIFKGVIFVLIAICFNAAFLLCNAVKVILCLPFSKCSKSKNIYRLCQSSDLPGSTCAIISHLNSTLDLDSEDDFYFPSLALSIKAYNATPIFIYTNKPGFDVSVGKLLTQRRKVLCNLIPAKPLLLAQLKIYLYVISNDIFLLLFYFPRLFFVPSPKFSRRYLLLLVGSSRHSIPNLWLCHFLLQHLKCNQYDHIIYPYEGNSWESMLCLAAKNVSSSQIHAYCHTEVRPDFRLLNPLFDTCYMPHHFLLSHPSYKSNLTQSYPSLSGQRFTTVGFSSIYRAVNASCELDFFSTQSMYDELSLIFCPDGFWESSLSFLELAQSYFKHTSSHCAVCLHPSMYDQIASVASIYPGVSILRGPLPASIFARFKALVYHGSTVALVAAYLRIPLIFFQANENDKSPLSYLLGDSFAASSVEELVRVTDNIRHHGRRSRLIGSASVVPCDPFCIASSMLR
jgi:hypothetical protein